MSSAAMMQHRCTIMRNTPANVDGQIVPDWANVTTGQRCLIQEGSGEVKATRGGQGLVYDAIGFFPAATDIRPRGQHDQSDRITLTAPTHLNGVTFLVNLVTDESGMGNHLTAYLTRLPAG